MTLHSSKSFPSRVVSSERGVYLVFVSFILVAIFGILALAVDISMITLAQVKVRRATEAALTAGLSYRIRQGWGFFRAPADANHLNIPNPDLQKEQDLRRIANEAAHINLDDSQGFTNFECGSGGVQRSCGYRNNDAAVRSWVEYSSNDDLIRAETSIIVPLFFSGLLGRSSACQPYVAQPGAPANPAPGACHISFQGNSQLNPARIALVLDTSGSMNCPNSDTTNCACRTQPGGCAASTDTRIFKLRDAVKLFAERLNPRRDLLSMVPYNYRAEDPGIPTPAATFWVRAGGNGPNANNARPFGDPGTAARPFVFPGPPSATINPTSRYNEFFQRVEFLRATGDTNTSDGLYAARRDFDLASLTGQHFTVVLFSDGAPTASTVRFVTPNPEMRRLFNINLAATAAATDPNNLTTQFVVEFSVANPVPGNPPIKMPGPSPLMRADQVQYGKIPSNMATPNPPFPAPPVVPRCGTLETNYQDYYKSMWAFLAPLNPGDPPAQGCLNNSAFYKDRDQPGQGTGVANYPVTCQGSPHNCSSTNADINCIICLNNTVPSAGQGWDDTQWNEWQDFTHALGNSGTWSLPYYQLQRNYNAAIDAADNVRRSGGQVIVVALGPTGAAAVAGDPYWKLWDDFSRKDVFLRRLAWDIYRVCSAGNEPGFQWRNIPTSGTNFWGYTGYDSMPTCPSPGDPLIPVDGNSGRYVPVVNPNALPSVFSNIAADILLRLNP